MKSSLEFIDRAVTSATSRTGRFVTAHARGLTTTVMLALAGFGVTAFGIAPMAPDASDLPKRLVTQAVTPDGLDSQLDALADHDLQLYRTDLTRSSDTADSLLQRLGVSDAEAALFLRRDATARQVLEGHGGKMVRVQTGENGALTELVARYAPADSEQLGTHFTRLSIKRGPTGLTTSVETAELATQVRMGSGTIRSSLFAATDDARIPDNVAVQLADVFATDIDFHRELRKGDTFSVIFEALTADGEPITWSASAGRVLAADFVNNGRTYSAVWFQDPQGKGAYFSFDGESKKRAFLASPMEFSRVTSGFAMRLHPIQNIWKQHKGVDYGAPSGTPIRAVGDGVVDFAGHQNGYGNVVEIRHSNDRSTLYAHMSRIDVRRGQRVEQGQRIGAVGATGWATGPHLHFEVKVAGVQKDPVIMAKASEVIKLAPQAKREFAKLARGLESQLEVADTVARSGGTYVE
ncbi:MAG: M23 family metallopeptidase [Burkholderiaceae bacterium]